MQRLRVGLKQAQKLKLTAELRQSLEILALNTMELAGFLKEIIVDNPVIEIEEYPDESYEAKSELYEEKKSLLEAIEKNDYSDYSYTKEEAGTAIDFAYKEDTLVEDLAFQFNAGNYSQREKTIAEYIFYNLDTRGYLTISPEDISEDLGVDIGEVSGVRQVIGGLDPPGVGARDLRECLLMQNRDGEISEEIIRYNLEDIGANRLNKIAKERGISIEEVKEKIAYIRSLEVNPCGSYGDNQPIQYIVPEASIVLEDGNLVLYMENEYIPKIQINPYYKNLEKNADEETLKYLKDKISAAEWISNSLAQRENSIRMVLLGLMSVQEDFFKLEKETLNPLRQKDLAEAVGLSEATISRVVNGKYVATPRGIYEIKELFSGELSSATKEEDLSVADIKAKIKDIIDGEDKKKPLSDAKIEEILKDQGVKVARRTIAKYRKEMDIPKTSLRREY